VSDSNLWQWGRSWGQWWGAETPTPTLRGWGRGPQGGGASPGGGRGTVQGTLGHSGLGL